MKTKTRNTSWEQQGPYTSLGTSGTKYFMEGGSGAFPASPALDESIVWETRLSKKPNVVFNNRCYHRKNEFVLPLNGGTDGRMKMGACNLLWKCLTSTTMEWVGLEELAQSESAYARVVYNYADAPLVPQDFLDTEIENAYNLAISGAQSAAIYALQRSTPNVVQSILELKDTAANLKGALQALELLNLAMGKRGYSIRGFTLGEISSDYLWYQFGLRPTIRDWEQVWEPITRGKFKLLRNDWKPGDSIRIPYSVPYQDDRSMDPPTGWPSALLTWYHNGYVSGPTLLQNSSKVPDQVYTHTFGNALSQSINSFTSALNLWPQRARVWSAKGVVYGKVHNLSLNDCCDEGSWHGELKRGMDRLSRQHSINRASWEVIPFSFVVDWAFNIGEYVSYLEGRNALSDDFISFVDGMWQTLSREVATWARYPVITPVFVQSGDYASVSFEAASPRWVRIAQDEEFVRKPSVPVTAFPRRRKLKPFAVGPLLAMTIGFLKGMPLVDHYRV